MKCLLACFFLLLHSGILHPQVTIQQVDSIVDTKNEKVKADQDVVNEIIAKGQDSLREVVSSIKDSINILNGTIIIPESDLDSLKMHPQILYEHSLLRKGHRNTLNSFQFVLSILVLGFFLYKGFRLAKRSALCRDESYAENQLVKMDEAGKPYIENPFKELNIKCIPPYSFARAQMFWWTIIILGCYIIFFGLTGKLVPLNSTSVILLGLGAFVLTAGRLIDKQQIKNEDIKLGSRAQDKNKSNDFFINILSDEKGVSIHRYQALVFNVIFGIGFLSAFIRAVATEQYPFIEFNEWQFALMGISAATYLGLKSAENQPPEKESNEEKNKEKPKEKAEEATTEIDTNTNVNDESNSEQHDR